MLIIWIIVGFILGSVSHECDLARNFNETGDAKSWIFPIKDNPTSTEGEGEDK